MIRAFTPVSALMLAVAAAIPAFVPTAAMAAPAPAYSDRISVTVTGKGPDVILIPGLASSANVWDATVMQIAPHHRVHVIQVAGFAGAEAKANATGPVLTPVLAAIHDYIAAAHLKAPAIIGHSVGGLIAMKLAIEHPDDVGRLMLVDSLPFLGLLIGPQATTASVELAAAGTRARLLATSQEDFARSQPAAMTRMVKSNGPARDAAVAAASTSDRRVVAQVMYEGFMTDLRGDLAHIRQPVTIVYPWDETTRVPQAASDHRYQSAFAGLPQAKFQRIDGSYHFIMIDQPAAFAGAVDTFLPE